MPKYAILGAQGRLGREFVRRLGRQGVGLIRAQADLGDIAQIARTLEALHPSVVINAAAYNMVDLAESRHQTALEVNFAGPALLADLCRRRAWQLLHVSTDYVFGADGLERPRRESDPPAPMNFYGYSKLAGEEAVLLRNPDALVVRVAHLYGGEADRADLVVRLLEQARRGEPLRVTRGQWLNPTPVPELAGACLRLLRRGSCGLVHLTGAGACPIAEFAAAVLRRAGIDGTVIELDSDPRPAPRATRTVLASRPRPRAGVRGVGDWQRSLATYIERLQRQAAQPQT